MQVKCDYCRGYISDTDEFCEYCGASNAKLKRTSFGAPQTINELKQWYLDHNLPSERITRFFIGKNIKEPKAFGIYYDEKKDLYIVYKNKSNGVRSIRYEGKDETYAVNELYIKLKEEIMEQKARSSQHRLNNSGKKKRKSGCFTIIMVFILASLLAIIQINTLFSDGYYHKDNKIYYLVEDCSFFNKEKCIWYEYNQNFDEWNNISAIKNIKVSDKLTDLDSSKIKVNTKIIMDLGYYVYNNEVYYSYNSCTLYNIKNCEWYKYNINNKSWSIVDFNSNIKGNHFIDSIWQNFDNPYYSTITIEKDYKDEQWYRQLHPTKPMTGYYIYDNYTYYYYNYDWYIYNNGWSKSNNVSDDLNINHRDYYEINYNKYSSNIDELFTESTYYKNNSSSSSYDDDWFDDDNSWDDDSYWDSSDSWDSGGTDWESDW